MLLHSCFCLKQYLLSARVTISQGAVTDTHKHATQETFFRSSIFLLLSTAVNKTRRSHSMQTRKHILVFKLQILLFKKTWQLKTAFPLPWSNLSLRSLTCKAPFIHSRTVMTIQMLKPSIQQGDHNNSKKFPKTSSEFISEYPMGQREPS